jgi:ethanolamine ammonia-lyase large subunit
VGGTAFAIGLGSHRRRLADARQVSGTSVPEMNPGEDIFTFVRRVKGRFDDRLYKQILGAANE